MGGNGKYRWKISFHRPSSSSSSSSSSSKPEDPPNEFMCPISQTLMSDPVIVASGHTFELVSVQVCRDLGFSPTLEGGSNPDFSTIIPNLAIKTAISNWCVKSGVQNPTAPDYSSVERLVRAAMTSPSDSGVSDRDLLNAVADIPPVNFSHAATELGPRVNHFNLSSTLPLTTRPTCYSSSEIDGDEVQNRNPTGSISEEEEKFVSKLSSIEVSEQEEAVISLRNITRTREDARVSLCTNPLLSSLRSLIGVRNSVVVQVNAVASVVNFSLDKSNKVRIVRLGFIPFLINVLKEGFTESQEHAAGALFSLALDDENKMAIGVMGALEPLMNALRSSESERTRHDSAMALYHLSLAQSNRVKLVKLGVVPTLLSMVKSGKSASRVLLILCNLAACTEGRTAMLDANAVECVVEVLKKKKKEGSESESEALRENCVVALYGMSHGSLRFRGLAKQAGAMEVLREVEEKGSERAREKARRILQMMKAPDEENGSGFDETGGVARTRFRVGAATNNNVPNWTT